MRATLFFAAIPALVLAAPDRAPQITSLKFSGSGCPNDSGSVKAVYGELGDNPVFTFSQLRGADTGNCELHIQSSGASQGWQVAVKEVTYQGNVQLSSGSQLDTITQAFWSEHAADTTVLRGSVVCAGSDIKDYVTVRSSTNDLKWSKCTGSDGNPGILNVNARPVVQGNSGTYDIKQATWGLQWRKC
ncbi:hypothetical protein BU23DRAFT_583263 [Bimuria novae-zelandiae CBS 107.79]|uniref:Secreted protein n=1 Tax=Bimuria novae-zelandiae CBS 107.79 TaxID=1447943 RepID=A0A6A5UUQ8_9PLEO|nr:hypothetical protein BU23DRAFT_583263 [Bimuria novae-zelandiae CBS 107.79]